MSAEVFGPVLLAALGLAGFALLFRAMAQAPLSAAQRTTGYLALGGLILWALIWLALEAVTLLATGDPGDHITRTTATVLLTPEGRAGFALLAAGVGHLTLHLRWRRYPLWPSGAPHVPERGRRGR